MKNFKYTVKGLNSPEKAKESLELLAKILPESTEASVDTEQQTLKFSASLNKKGLADAELRLEGAFAARDMELILPVNTDRYVFVKKKPGSVPSIPVAVAISLIAMALVLGILLSFSSCGALMFPNYGYEQTPVPEVNVNIDDLPPYIEDLIKLDEVFKQYSYEGIDEELMGEMILKAYIAATGDMYAEYMNEEEYEAYFSENAGEFVGVGVSIVNTAIEINGMDYKVLQIISVFKDSPALENGLAVGDCIMYVGKGEDRKMVNSLGYNEALNQMLGEAGSMAEFTVFRPDKNEEMGYQEIEFSIERRKVETQAVYYRVSETDGRVGIINITGFDMTTAPQFCEAVDTLKTRGCEFFVFDLRNNPGGALPAIEAVLSYFLSEGDLIVSTEMADGSKTEDFVRAVNYGPQYAGYNVARSDIGKYKDLKSVVLVNENSASAAELFTATFRDYGLAEIVGNTTYGKGCMQTILPLQNAGLEGGLRVTTAMYFSKSHTVYHEKGIEPDHKIQLSQEALNYNFFLLPEEKDNQMQKAIEVLFK